MPEPAPPNPFGITKIGTWTDLSPNPTLRDQLETTGIQYDEYPLPHLVGMGGTATLIGYTSPATQQPVTVLLVPHRPDIDSFAEDYYYCEGLPLFDAAAKGEPYWIDQVYPHVKEW